MGWERRGACPGTLVRTVSLCRVLAWYGASGAVCACESMSWDVREFVLGRVCVGVCPGTCVSGGMSWDVHACVRESMSWDVRAWERLVRACGRAVLGLWERFVRAWEQRRGTCPGTGTRVGAWEGSVSWDGSVGGVVGTVAGRDVGRGVGPGQGPGPGESRGREEGRARFIMGRGRDHMRESVFLARDVGGTGQGKSEGPPPGETTEDKGRNYNWGP